MVTVVVTAIKDLTGILLISHDSIGRMPGSIDPAGSGCVPCSVNPRSESYQSVCFYYERTIPKCRKSGPNRPNRIVFVGVNRKEFAARPILPTEPVVAAVSVIAQTPLKEGAQEHARRKTVIGPRSQQLIDKVPSRKPHLIDRQPGLD